MSCGCGSSGGGGVAAGGTLLSGTLDDRYGQASAQNAALGSGATGTNPLFAMLHSGAFWFVAVVIVAGIWLWDSQGE
jgi:hypothetical protein